MKIEKIAYLLLVFGFAFKMPLLYAQVKPDKKTKQTQSKSVSSIKTVSSSASTKQVVPSTSNVSTPTKIIKDTTKKMEPSKSISIAKDSTKKIGIDTVKTNLVSQSTIAKDTTKTFITQTTDTSKSKQSISKIDSVKTKDSTTTTMLSKVNIVSNPPKDSSELTPIFFSQRYRVPALFSFEPVLRIPSPLYLYSTASASLGITLQPFACFHFDYTFGIEYHNMVLAVGIGYTTNYGFGMTVPIYGEWRVFFNAGENFGLKIPLTLYWRLGIALNVQGFGDHGFLSEIGIGYQYVFEIEKIRIPLVFGFGLNMNLTKTLETTDEPAVAVGIFQLKFQVSVPVF